jgi:pilus assembly protein FimV
MDLFRSIGIAAVVLGLLAVAFPAEAFNLGRARATVVFGRPLQLTIPVTLEPDETELCAQAELFQGDTRSGPLEVLLERSAEGRHQFRVRSAAVVEEPVVNVYLRVGCVQQSTRSYAFLTEQIYDSAAAAPAPPAPALAPASLLAPMQPAPAVPAPAAPVVQTPFTQAWTASPPREPRQAPVTAAQAAPIAPPAAPPREKERQERKQQAPRAAGSAPAAATVPTEPRPRLKLESVEGFASPSAGLKVSPFLSMDTFMNPSFRTDAAGAWRALNATQDEQIARSQRSEALENEVKALREAMQKHTASLSALSEQLDRVRGERNVASSVLGVFAGGVALGLIVMLWFRSRESAIQEARWRELATQQGRSAEQPRRSRPRTIHDAISDVDSDWTSMDSQASREQRAEGVRSKPVALGPLPEFAESENASRLPKAEELLDIKQRTDFFLAIGEHERAVELLEAQIHDQLGSSPVVWLDLLDICHQFGRREDYERIRAEYQATFKARLPAFDAVRDGPGGLEEHPRALSRIVLLWPSPRVLKVIEEALFENQSTPSAVAFDLEASRDLLLLYGIAREVVRQRQEEGFDEVPPSRPASFAASNPADPTEPIPLATLDDEEPEEALEPIAMDIDFRSRPSSLRPPPPIAPAATPMPTEFDYDFEPKARHSSGR